MKDDNVMRQLALFIKVNKQSGDSRHKKGGNHYAPGIVTNSGADEKTINALPNMKYPHASAPRQADLERAK